MRQACLPGTKARAPADDRSRRRAVMRRAKRRVADQRMIRVDEACNGMDPCHLERLLLLERREDSRQPPGQHRLPDPRWTTQQEVVATRCGELERTSCAFLT